MPSYRTSPSSPLSLKAGRTMLLLRISEKRCLRICCKRFSSSSEASYPKNHFHIAITIGCSNLVHSRVNDYQPSKLQYITLSYSAASRLRLLCRAGPGDEVPVICPTPAGGPTFHFRDSKALPPKPCCREAPLMSERFSPFPCFPPLFELVLAVCLLWRYFILPWLFFF